MSALPTRLFSEKYDEVYKETMKRHATNPFEEEAEEYRDCWFVPNILSEVVKYVCEEWEPKDDDIIIASGIRCGTHWLGDIVSGILYGRDDRLYSMSRQVDSVLQVLSVGEKSKFKLLDDMNLPRRIFFTHLLPEILPMEKFMAKKLKIFHIMRNPLDRLLSWFNLIFQYQYLPLYSKNFDQFFEDYITGQQPIMMKRGQTYADYILSWLPYRENENVKFLYFEDIKANPEKKVSEIAEFLEIPLTKIEIEDVIENTTITKAQENIAKEQSAMDAFKKKFKLVGKGNVGSWKTNPLMTEEKVSRILSLVDEKLKETDIKFTYEATGQL